jgi:hypothetical protein
MFFASASRFFSAAIVSFKVWRVAAADTLLENPGWGRAGEAVVALGFDESFSSRDFDLLSRVDMIL